MKRILVLITLLFSSLGHAQEKSYAFTLEDAINYAMTNSYAIRLADLDINAAEKKKWETTAIGLPQIDADGTYSNFLKQGVTLIPSEIFGGPPGEFEEVVFGTKQNLTGTVTLNQLLFDGSYLIGLQAAETYLKISSLSKDKTNQTVREAVISAYGQVLISKENIRILENNRALLQKNLDETKIIFQNGMTEEQDVEQQQITLSNIENELNKAIRLESIAEQMFNLSLGIPIDSEVQFLDTIENIGLKSSDLALLSQDFDLKNHIDYKIADNVVTTNELMVKYEKSRALPTLNAFLNYSVFANNDNNIFFENNGEWFDSSLLGVNLKIPIFSSLGRSARTQQAKIELMQSQITLDETSQKLKLQVDTARNKYQFALDQYQTSKENLVLAESIARKEQIKFFEGLSSSFNLTNSQNQLFNSQQNYLQSILNIIQSKVALENALNNFSGY
jgi:outer membrane protein TolC